MWRFQGFRAAPPAEYIVKDLTQAGAAPDYEGIVFSDGTVVCRWTGTYRSHSVWRNFADFYQVHGHPEYGTRIVWLDGDGVKLLPKEAG
jgi:hypothetical protein